MKILKKTVGVTMALSLALCTLYPSISQAQAVTPTPIQSVNLNNSSLTTLNLPSASTIETFIQKSSKEIESRIVWNINTKDDYFRLLDKIFTELPSKVSIISSLSKEDADSWYSEYQLMTIPSRMNNVQTLASYSITKKRLGKLIVLTDKSNKKYSAKQIEDGVKAYAKEFATQIEGLNTEQKINVIYDFIYSQYQYKASSYSEMLVGNAYTKQLACNGFSRLFYELAVASGVNAKLIEADDHFYNHVETSSGQWVILDVTTDIILKTKHGATGLSKEDYLSYVSKVGFYWATPVNREPAVATSWTVEQKESFLSSVKLSNE